MKRSIYLIPSALAVCFFLACNSSNQSNTNGSTTTATNKDSGKVDKGIGQYSKITLTHPLDTAMVATGKGIFDSKCMACHKLTDEKLVGPGWKGITDRRAPEWIMNFITNTNVMLDSDLVAQQLMVTCVTRMPSQNLTAEQARAILEFMRKNDGKN
jgi:mono/diheme cytochrome c family protein